MAVYCIQAGDRAKVKIGTADDPAARLRELQCAHFDELRIIRIIEGGRPVERWLHRHFAPYRIRGEWFRLVDDMLVIEPPSEAPAPAPSPLARYLAANGMAPREFAPQIGLTTEAVRLLINGDRRPNSTTMQRIIEATAGKVLPNDFFDVPEVPGPPEAAAEKASAA